MGMDFVTARAPSFKKAWDQSLVELGTSNLFTREPERIKRTAAFSIIGNKKLNPGDYVRVKQSNGCLIAIQEMSEIARADSPPIELLDAVINSQNIASGTVEQVYDLSGVVDIYLS
jgi:sugar (pentulose or hexulose) kinase